MSKTYYYEAALIDKITNGESKEQLPVGGAFTVHPVVGEKEPNVNLLDQAIALLVTRRYTVTSVNLHGISFFVTYERR